jgi:hypothetical protein
MKECGEAGSGLIDLPKVATIAKVLMDIKCYQDASYPEETWRRKLGLNYWIVNGMSIFDGRSNEMSEVLLDEMSKQLVEWID